MIPITWMNSFYPKIFGNETFIPMKFKTALDVGCGKGTTATILRNYRSPERIEGLDAFLPYLHHCSKFGCYDALHFFNLSKTQSLPFQDKEFDLVLCLEVVEHLYKTEAMKLLDELKRIGKHIIVSTPSTFNCQTSLDNNPFQIHKCRLSKKDFESKNFVVTGTGSFKFFVKYIPFESQLLGRLFPERMQTLIAIFK